MKTIALLGAAVIAGAIRYPQEGPQTVPDEVADHLVEQGLAEVEGEEKDDPEAAEDLDALSVPSLKELAAAEGVTLGDATKKADIIAAIQAHRAAA